MINHFFTQLVCWFSLGFAHIKVTLLGRVTLILFDQSTSLQLCVDSLSSQKIFGMAPNSSHICCGWVRQSTGSLMVLLIYIYIYMYIYWLVVWNLFLFFHSVGNFIIPTDELIFFRGVETTNQYIYIFIHDTISDHRAAKTLTCFLDVLILIPRKCLLYKLISYQTKPIQSQYRPEDIHKNRRVQSSQEFYLRIWIPFFYQVKPR